MIMIDSDVLIWILRDREDIVQRFKEINLEYNGLLFITPIQIIEIYSGLRDKEREKVEYFINSLGFTEVDRDMSKLSGELMRNYRKSDGISISDSIIASAAIINNLVLNLFTGNDKIILPHQN
ncbi:MAG TPA: PIN domain-containing protein, partial [Spirochaetota bacterium]|nr:PIN domain-containing protein [Spirochaetota bacterium]